MAIAGSQRGLGLYMKAISKLWKIAIRRPSERSECVAVRKTPRQRAAARRRGVSRHPPKKRRRQEDLRRDGVGRAVLVDVAAVALSSHREKVVLPC